MLSQERVKELFNYADGNLVRLVGLQGCRKGDVVGSKTKNGYLHTRVDGSRYYNHRLVWLWHKGYVVGITVGGGGHK